MRSLRSTLTASLALLVLAAPALAAAPPAGSVYTEEYFTGIDGTTLHADVFRPAGLAPGTKTPVIMTVSPYLAHSGSTSFEAGNPGGPSNRFYDFIEQSGLLQKGYTWVQVDLRGYGGSGGCGDWGGPGEQLDVKSAVEHYASRDWSTGKVGLYGKSYDGWTGLMGLVQRPEGLGAVIAQEPVYDGYRYLYMNRVPFSNRLGTPLGFRLYDLKPGNPRDTPQYQANGLVGTATNPTCYVSNIVDAQSPDDESPYWAPRDLVDGLKGNTVPTLLTQGFLETNTKMDAALEAWNNLSASAPGSQAIFGQFDHVRINDREAGGTLPAMGREDLIAQAMRFYDAHLKGAATGTEDDPVVAVQDNRGDYREEQLYPPADTRRPVLSLTGGNYFDDGSGRLVSTTASGLWTATQAFDREVHLVGAPVLTVEAAQDAPDSNLVAGVYDLAPDGEATLVSRGGYSMPENGRHTFELYGQDWRFAAGHRLVVLLTDADTGWFSHEESGARVLIEDASLELPLAPAGRSEQALGGTGPTGRLDRHLATSFTLPEAALEHISTLETP